MIGSVWERIERSKLLIAYGAVVVAMVIGFAYMQNLADRLEREGIARAAAVCQNSNEIRTVLTAVLDELAKPRPDDQPGEYERRQEIRRELDPILRKTDCPPAPT